MKSFLFDRKRVTYLLVAFFIGSLGLYVFYLQGAFGGNFFGQRTTQQNIKIGEGFVRDSEVDNSALGTVLSQISFGNGMIKFETTPRNIDHLFQNIGILINTDIFELLSGSHNPEKVLSSHITHLDETLFSIREVEDSLSRSIQSYLDRSNSCLNDKNQGDQQYIQGIQQGNSDYANEGLMRSLDNAPCYITNRIKANAQLILLQKATAYVNLLQRRYQILSQNKETILTHKDYLQGDILDELLLLRQQLRAINNFQTPTSRNRNISGETIGSSTRSIRNFAYDLPIYDGFIIRPDHIPTFENPGLETVVNPSESPLLRNPLIDNPVFN